MSKNLWGPLKCVNPARMIPQPRNVPALFGMRLAAYNQEGGKPTDDVTLLIAGTTKGISLSTSPKFKQQFPFHEIKKPNKKKPHKGTRT